VVAACSSPTGSEDNDNTDDTNQPSLAAGSLVINEFMADPAAPVNDDNGEWIELYVNTTEEINLNGLVIRDEDVNSFTIDSDLIVQPGDYVLLGRNADTLSNGGVAIDYEYTDFTLGNGSDEIIIESGSVEVDRVVYDFGTDWSALDVSGASANLDSSFRNALTNDSATAWCNPTNSYDGGNNFGTPGAANESCP
jgi:hypothetical protein